MQDIQGEGAAGPMSIRVYDPEPQATAARPALIFIHGGGWSLNSVESHDSVCRALAKQAQIVVLSLDYRLAPEHAFPAPLEDCYAATQWIANNAQQLSIDPTRLALGESNTSCCRHVVQGQNTFCIAAFAACTSLFDCCMCNNS